MGGLRDHLRLHLHGAAAAGPGADEPEVGARLDARRDWRHDPRRLGVRVSGTGHEEGGEHSVSNRGRLHDAEDNAGAP